MAKPRPSLSLSQPQAYAEPGRGEHGSQGAVGARGQLVITPGAVVRRGQLHLPEQGRGVRVRVWVRVWVRVRLSSPYSARGGASAKGEGEGWLPLTCARNGVGSR